MHSIKVYGVNLRPWCVNMHRLLLGGGWGGGEEP